jgi:TonB family protein
MNYAPQLQAVAPQVINPRVVAESSPVVIAQAIQMDSVSTSVAPTTIARSNTVVERVSVVNSIVTARAAAVDVSRVGASAVRGPVKVHSPVGPSVGPRKVAATATGSTIGTGTLSIGEGSSVREGVVSNRDVLGSPSGARLVSVNIAVGEGNLRGSGGSGSGLRPGGSGGEPQCVMRPEVLQYMEEIRVRTENRWKLPPGLAAAQEVTLRFKVDAAGSATDVELVHASDNALGVSAIDAMRSASPFPPIPEAARCLAQKRIKATFSSDSFAG